MFAGCSAYGEDERAAEETPPPVAVPDAATEAAPIAPDATPVDAGRTCARTRALVFQATADTTLNSSCAGSVSYGASSFANINGDGLLLLKFDLDVTVVGALTAGRVESIRLELTDNRNCESCGSGIPPRAGQFTAHVLRNDWIEGTSTTNYSGADRCRRTTGNPGTGWGPGQPASQSTAISSPADYGSKVGTGDIAGPDDKVLVLLLDPTAVATGRLEYAREDDATELSLLVKRGNEGEIVIATREEEELTPPKLEVTICEE